MAVSYTHLDVYKRQWKGTLTEDELGKVIEQNKNAMTQSSEENAIYGTTLQPIDDKMCIRDRE